jgi:hypothetical protein
MVSQSTKRGWHHQGYPIYREMIFSLWKEENVRLMLSYNPIDLWGAQAHFSPWD